MSDTTPSFTQYGLALLVMALGFTGAAPEASAECDVNHSATCDGGNCKVNAEGSCTGGNCRVNHKGTCNGNCLVNVGATCSSSGSCEVSAASSTCAGACNVNVQLSQCSSTGGRCRVNVESRCATGGTCGVSYRSGCTESGSCAVNVEAGCGAGRCTVNVRAGCNGTCPLNYANVCRASQAAAPAHAPGPVEDGPAVRLVAAQARWREDQGALLP